MANPQEKKRGNPGWQPGVSGNTAGRPKTIDRDKKTNREIRSDTLLHLVRKFRPHLTRAINAAVEILENKDASESGKLRASALIITTYRELVKDVYDLKYDDEEGEEIQESNKMPAFSLRMIPGKSSEEDKEQQ